MLAYIGLGSNLGDREAAIRKAIERLRGMEPEVEVLRLSPLYETTAVLNGPVSEEEPDPNHIPPFLNSVAEVETRLSPEALLDRLMKIESEMGRQRPKADDEGTPGSFRPFMSRGIDLDVLFYGDRIFRSRRLSIPHPRAHRRSFVMFPMRDLCPDYMHPVLHQSVEEICLEPLEPEAIKRIEHRMV